MCFKGGGGGGPQYQYYLNSQGQFVVGEAGLPQDAIDAGVTSNTAYQGYLQQKLADQQIAAQKEIADRQETFNQQQLQYQKDLQAQQQAATDAQAQRQTDYDTGRQQQLSEATGKVNDAFSGFTPDYYTQYKTDYMSQVQDQVNQQRTQALKDIGFGLARQGIIDSQAKANELGLLSETEGRTIADQTQNAQNAANTLQANVAQTKAGLMQQIANAQNVSSPIAAGTIGDMRQQLDTSRQAITGIVNNAGDVTASLKGVPVVQPLSNIFAGVVGNLGSYLSGANQNYGMNLYRNAAGLQGTSPY